MTRKRYIKLMMSKGYSRNSAREESGFVVVYNQMVAKYKKAYKEQNILYREDSLSYDNCCIQVIHPTLYERV